jgi:hypothetical protein
VRHVKAFGRFWYDFVIGDDWVIAVVVVVAVTITALLARNTSFPAWIVMPAAAVGVLAVSILRAGAPKP